MVINLEHIGPVSEQDIDAFYGSNRVNLRPFNNSLNLRFVYR